MTHAEQIAKIRREFLGDPGGYTLEELREIYECAKMISLSAAVEIAENHAKDR
jgi:hypothetical protein